MKLYLIRHGQTQWNIDGKIQGKTDISLNETGILQAEQLAGAMEDRPISAVFTSPLKRADETANIVAAKTCVPVLTVDELREVDFGLWEGLTWQEIGVKYAVDAAAWDVNPVLNTPTGGEPRENCMERSKKAMEYILSHAEGDIAIVAHGGILVFLVDYLLRTRKDKNEIIVKNASITTVEYDKNTGEGNLCSLNETDHLSPTITGKINKYC